MPDGKLAIRFGLGVIKNVGSAAVEGIIAARKVGGPYRDLEDFCKRADLTSANSRAIEHLAMAGAFDLLGLDRGTLVVNSERVMNLARRERELRESGQSTMFDLFGSEVDTPLPALELEARPVSSEQMLTWEKDVLGVYVSEHPFRAAAGELMRYTSHSLSDLNTELVGQTVTVAGMVQRVQTRATRDGRKFYVVDIEDLSGTAEVTVWNDTIEQTGEETWSEGQLLLCSVEVRERGDRMSLSMRRASPFNRTDGTVVGFTPAQFQVKESRPSVAAGYVQGPAGGGMEVAPASPSLSNGNRPRPNGHAAAATTEASRPGVQPPVSGDAARLIIQVFETEDALADEALLKAVAGMLRDNPGSDEVRLVITDANGQDTEFDLPRASATEGLARSIRTVLRQNGHVRLTGTRLVA
jgi:DNA polymerase-3 subunit alpha